MPDGRDITFRATTSGRRLRAFLVRPDGDPAKARPAVLVVHEMRGLNDDIRRIATEFADHGYHARAPPTTTGPRPWAMAPATA